MKKKVLLLFIITMLFSCHSEKKYFIDFTYSYSNWFPVDKNKQFVFSNSAGDKLIFGFGSEYQTEQMIFIDSDEGCTCYYFANEIEITYVTEENDRISYKYYIIKDYGYESDMLDVSALFFPVRINAASISNYDYDDIYKNYCNFQYADTVVLNGKTFNDVFFRESLKKDKAVYYQKGNGVIAFKSEHDLYVLNEN